MVNQPAQNFHTCPSKEAQKPAALTNKKRENYEQWHVVDNQMEKYTKISSSSGSRTSEKFVTKPAAILIQAEIYPCILSMQKQSVSTLQAYGYNL